MSSVFVVNIILMKYFYANSIKYIDTATYKANNSSKQQAGKIMIVKKVNTGKSLNVILAKRGMSKKELSAIYPCSQSQVSNMARNRTMSWESLERLCEIFEIEPSEFVAEGQNK